MIKRISTLILQHLLRAEVIKDTQEVKDYYQYGIEITISSLLNVFWIFMIGFAFGSIKESAVFLLCFIPLRMFTGGYHANTYFLCNLFFAISFFIVLFTYHLTAGYITTYAGLLITILSCVIFFSECPVENPNKPLPVGKKRVYKVLSIVLGMAYGGVAVALISFSNKMGAMLLYTLALINFLIIIAAFRDLRKKGKS